MGKYINKGTGTLIVLGVRYKKGEKFTLTEKEEKKVSSLFLDDYSIKKSSTRGRPKKDESDEDDEPEEVETEEVKDSREMLLGK